MKQKYWEIRGAETSYERYVFVNGFLEHEFGIPGVECPRCNDAWAGCRVLPVRCPKEFRGRRELRDRWPILPEEHRELRADVEKMLSSEGFEKALMPGDIFQPAILRLLSRPRHSFLWPIPRGIIVSAEVRRLFEDGGVSGVSFCKAKVRSAGRFEPDDPLPELDGLERIEDTTDHADAEADPDGFGPLYEMLIIQESGIPPGIRMVRKCGLCGYEEFDRDEHELRLSPDILPETDVFNIATTLHVVVNERVRRLSADNGLINITFSEVPCF